jgi:primary-amine oxidase
MSAQDPISKSSILLGEQRAVTFTQSHPLHIITDDEISRASAIVTRLVQEQDKANGTKTHIRFKNISLHEPPKALLLPYLDAEAAGRPLSERPFVPRCVDVIWSSENERKITESIVSMDSNAEVGRMHASYGQHGSIDR